MLFENCHDGVFECAPLFDAFISAEPRWRPGGAVPTHEFTLVLIAPDWVFYATHIDIIDGPHCRLSACNIRFVGVGRTYFRFIRALIGDQYR
jgi:hypothetical protein